MKGFFILQHMSMCLGISERCGERLLDMCKCRWIFTSMEVDLG